MMSQFLQLPVEIRHAIYQEAMAPDTGGDLVFSSKWSQKGKLERGKMQMVNNNGYYSSRLDEDASSSPSTSPYFFEKYSLLPTCRQIYAEAGLLHFMYSTFVFRFIHDANYFFNGGLDWLAPNGIEEARRLGYYGMLTKSQVESVRNIVISGAHAYSYKFGNRAPSMDFLQTPGLELQKLGLGVETSLITQTDSAESAMLFANMTRFLMEICQSRCTQLVQCTSHPGEHVENQQDDRFRALEDSANQILKCQSEGKICRIFAQHEDFSASLNQDHSKCESIKALALPDPTEVAEREEEMQDFLSDIDWDEESFVSRKTYQHIPCDYCERRHFRVHDFLANITLGMEAFVSPLADEHFLCGDCGGMHIKGRPSKWVQDHSKISVSAALSIPVEN